MTKKKKLKQRVRKLARIASIPYVAARAQVVEGDSALQRARAHRRELVWLANCWVEGKPLDAAMLRHVVTAPIDWEHLEQVQSEMPFPEKAWPAFCGVLLQAREKALAEDRPTPLGPLPDDSNAAIRMLLDAMRERIVIARRSVRARERAMFDAHMLLQVLEIEIGIRSNPLAAFQEAEIRQVTGQFSELARGA